MPIRFCEMARVNNTLIDAGDVSDRDCIADTCFERRGCRPMLWVHLLGYLTSTLAGGVCTNFQGCTEDMGKNDGFDRAMILEGHAEEAEVAGNGG